MNYMIVPPFLWSFTILAVPIASFGPAKVHAYTYLSIAGWHWHGAASIFVSIAAVPVRSAPISGSYRGDVDHIYAVGGVWFGFGCASAPTRKTSKIN